MTTKKKTIKTNRGLYIHIPFCNKMCNYCDFTKVFYNEELCEKYLDELKKEMDDYSIEQIKTIYVGGGTPSSLSLKNLECLLKTIAPYYNKEISYTFECNVDSLTLEKIRLLKKYNVDRISLGVQSFNNKLLKLMNRTHTRDDVFNVVNHIYEEGIKDINIDLIYGFPGQTLDDIKEDLDEAMKLPITHISTYALMINEHTSFFNKHLKEASQDVLADQYNFIRKYLKNYGFERYEVSNFSKKGYESKHNLIYWHNEEYYGIGAGASGYLSNIRYENTKSIFNYIDGKHRINEEIVTDKDKIFYSIMLGLRLEEGICISSVNKYLNCDIISQYGNKLEKLCEKGLLIIENDYIKVSKDNLYILDYILEQLLF